MLIEVKQKTPMDRKRNVVYDVPCRDCQLAYIGQTTRRTMKKRMTEHKYDVKTGDPKNGIAVHVQKTQHSIDWGAARPLPSDIRTGGPWRPYTSGGDNP